ncbi:MAG: hypothetical protein HY234_04880 [Acidobacteria bacterium]|nr:hypothetical protein [Acidobacteriota bacterium]
MNRPAGVTVSAAFLILVSLVTALVGAVIPFVPPYVPPSSSPPPYYKAVMIFAAVVLIGSALWGLVTAVGLFHMRRWARMCILVIGALLVFFCCSLMALTLSISSTDPSLQSVEGVEIVLGIMAAIYLIPIALSIWWLLYFNRAAVKAAFLKGYPLLEGPQRPLSVAVIAWHLLVFALLTPMSTWFHWPAFILGMLFAGWSAVLIFWAFGIAQILIGVGLLRLKPWSLTAAVWFFGFWMINSIAPAIVAGSDEKILAQLKSMFPDAFHDGHSMALPNPWLGAVIGVLLAGLPIWYLLTRKRAFLEAGERYKNEA